MSVIEKLAEIQKIMSLYKNRNPDKVTQKHLEVIQLYREIVIEIMERTLIEDSK